MNDSECREHITRQHPSTPSCSMIRNCRSCAFRSFNSEKSGRERKYTKNYDQQFVSSPSPDTPCTSSTKRIVGDATTKLTGLRECPTRSAEASHRTLPTRGLLAASRPSLPAQQQRR